MPIVKFFAGPGMKAKNDLSSDFEKVSLGASANPVDTSRMRVLENDRPLPELVYLRDEMPGKDLDSWIGMKPSECLVNNRMKIQVFKSKSDYSSFTKESQRKTFDRSRLLMNLKRHTDYSGGFPQRMMEEVMKSVAVQLDCASGKWFSIYQETSIDKVWQKFVRCFLDGAFGDELGVQAIQVDVQFKSGVTKRPGQPMSDKTFCISVHTDDWTDPEKRAKVHDVIESLKLTPKSEWAYKPDLYSICGIFRGNSYGLEPTLSRSREPYSMLGADYKAQLYMF